MKTKIKNLKDILAILGPTLAVFIVLIGWTAINPADAQLSGVWKVLSNKIQPVSNNWSLDINDSNTTSTIAFGLDIEGGQLKIQSLTSCDTIDTTSSGILQCGTDDTSAGGGGSNWQYDTNFGGDVLTTTSTIPIWAKDAVYASSTLTVSGNTSLQHATSTNFFTSTFGLSSTYITDFTDLLLDSFGQTSLSDPAADQLMFWDDSDTQFEFISTLTGASISGNTLTINDVSCTDCLNATEIEDIYLLNNGDVGTGAFDFGGATSLEVPNGATVTTNATGEIGVETTSSTLEFYDGTASRSLSAFYEKGVTIASTTLTSVADTTTATATIPAPAFFKNVTIQSITCYVTGGTSMRVKLSDGTNDMDGINCATTLTSDDGSIANNTLTDTELWEIQLGSESGEVDYISIQYEYTIDD